MGDNEPINNWVPPESMKATLVIYMAAKQSVLIRKALLNAGYKSATPAVFVENASLSNCHVFPTTIARIDEAAMQLGHGPAILLIGEVCTSIAYQLDAALFDQGSLTSLAY
jgi:siroheme synthase